MPTGEWDSYSQADSCIVYQSELYFKLQQWFMAASVSVQIHMFLPK